MIVVVQREEVQPVDQQQEVAHGLFMEDIYLIPATLEEMVIKADIIARVRLLSVKPAAVRSDPTYSSDAPIPEGLHIGSLAYRLDVLEYLKGEISTTTITAYAYGWNTIKYLYATTTVAGAEQLGRELLTTRDTRWDDREAIVLLRYNAAEQHHYLGLVGVERGAGYYDFTVASPMWKSWLPDAAEPTSSLDPHQIPPGPQRFLLDDPADYPTGSAVHTATLASLRETVQSLLRELAGGDGSQAYRDCVVYKYELHSQAAGSGSRDPTLVEMLSGMPAGTRVLETGFTEGFEAGRFPDLDPSFWSAGPDRDVLLGAWPSVITTARPLPAGKYNAWLRALSAKERICGDPVPKAWRKIFNVFLTVTSPAGTLAESFFDPYQHGNHRYHHRRHHLMAALFGRLRTDRPGHRGSGHRRHRPRPRLNRLGRNDHPVAGRRRRHPHRRHPELVGTHPALERGRHAHATDPQVRCPL